jgi:hypothetical protein
MGIDAGPGGNMVIVLASAREALSLALHVADIDAVKEATANAAARHGLDRTGGRRDRRPGVNANPQQRGTPP